MLSTHRLQGSGEKGIIVDSGQLIWIIIGVIVVLAIIAVVVVLGRRRKVDANRNRAVEMREQAKADELGAKEREAKALRAEADAKQAEVESERLRAEARGTQQEAESVRADVEEKRRKADELDPDVRTTKGGDGPSRTEAARGGTGEELRRDRGARNHVEGEPGTHRTDGANRMDDDQSHGDRPRNL
jgi:FtsZ-interacting cell division protein ZipA